MITALVKTDVAAAMLGWSVNRLFGLADGPNRSEMGFKWVFNLANNPDGQRRAFRWWLPEVQARASGKDEELRRYKIDTVLARILPATRDGFHPGEVDRLFQIRPRTRIDLHRDLRGVTRKDGRFYYLRSGLVQFLQRRWLGTGALGRETRAQRRPT